MALILEKANAQRAVWRNINVEFPTESGGYTSAKFRAKFQLLEADQMRDKKDEEIADFLREVIVDIEGVKTTEGGDPADFTPELVEQLLAIPWVRSALMKEYLLIPAGKKGQLKN